MFAPNESAEVGVRPLKMPESYDFSQRKVDWKSFKNDFILRTDAVWEKFKLCSYFYSVYKAVRLNIKFLQINRKKFTEMMASTTISLSNTHGKDFRTAILNGTF